MGAESSSMTPSDSGTLSAGTVDWQRDPAQSRATAGTVSWVTATAIVVADMVGVGVFTSLGFQVTDITVRLLAAVAVGRRRRRRDMRGFLLRRTRHDVSTVERRVQFSPPHLSSGVRLCCRLAVGDCRLRGADRARRHGVRRLFQIHRSGRAAAAARLCVTWLAALVHLGGVRFGGAYHNVWTALKLILIVVFIVAGFALGDLQPISFAPSAADLTAYRRRAVRHQPRVRDVFLLGLERRDLHRRRIARPEPQRAARAVRRHRDRHRSLCRPQRRLSDHHADEGNGRPARRRYRRRQAHIRQPRRPHRRRADLPRPGIVDQRHDLDRPARHHDDGRRYAAAALILAQVEAGRPDRRHRLSTRWSRTSCC